MGVGVGAGVNVGVGATVAVGTEVGPKFTVCVGDVVCSVLILLGIRLNAPNPHWAMVIKAAITVITAETFLMVKNFIASRILG